MKIISERKVFMKRKTKKKITALLISVMMLANITTPVFAAEGDQLVNSEIIMMDGVAIQQDTYVDVNGSIYKALKTANNTEYEFNAVMQYNMEKVNQLRNTVSILSDSLASYDTTYFYDFEYSPSTDKVSSQMFGNWFQGYNNGYQVIGIKENSQATASNSTYEKIVLDETIRFTGVNLEVSISLPPSVGFSASNEEHVYERNTENEGYGALTRNFDYPVSGQAGALTFNYAASYVNHVDGYIDGSPHEAVTSTAHSFGS